MACPRFGPELAADDWLEWLLALGAWHNDTVTDPPRRLRTQSSTKRSLRSQSTTLSRQDGPSQQGDMISHGHPWHTPTCCHKMDHL